MTRLSSNRWVHLALLGAALLCLVVARPALGQDFPDPANLDDRLTRGLSTKADVILAIGEPQGSGGAMLPTDAAAKEVWYYEKIRAQLLLLTGRQQVILVFFRGEVYDGYLWFDIEQDMHFK